MATEQGWATFASRLTSFEVSVPIPAKKRTSSAKGTRTISWPHKNPSPEDVARAGFYYKPSASSNDNTICFLCDRALDGWEEEDDPIAEHLKHSSRCGWAILMTIVQESLDPESMEDPTSERLSEARRATFTSGWPHDSKRGWNCKTDRMVEAGWYFAPTPESDDFVSCAYCKLSLDGWEPKDNPFDEHYRRSPECPFFKFAGTTAPKGGRSKKSRTSKASRLSTQSNLTVTSEIRSIPDLDESIDTSTVSVLSTSSTMANRKTARGKGKATRAKKAELAGVLKSEVSIVEIDSQAIAAKPPRGKKRTSDQISEDDRGVRESTIKPEPPTKRRNTRTRESALRDVEYPTILPEVDQMDVDAAPAKQTRGGKKRASTRAQKVSEVSTASVQVGLPDDAALEAVIEADLDRPMSDEEQLLEPENAEKPKRGKSKKVAASSAPSRSTRTAQVDQQAQNEAATVSVQHVNGGAEAPDTDVETQSKQKGRKARAGKKLAVTKTAQSTRKSTDSGTVIDGNVEHQMEGSILTTNIVEDDSGHETDASVASKAIPTKGSKKKAAGKGRGKKRGTGVISKNIEDVIQAVPQNQTIVEHAGTNREPTKTPTGDYEALDVEAQIAALTKEIEEEEETEKKQTRATKNDKTKASKAKACKPKDKLQHLSMPGAFSPMMLDQSAEPSFASVLSPTSPPVKTQNSLKQTDDTEQEEIEVLPEQRDTTPTPTRPAAPPIPPRSSARNTPATTRSAIPRPTPITQRSIQSAILEMRQPTTQLPPSSPSAQSSDAENAPPSSRPASVRPPLAILSPNKNQKTQLALAPGTPTKHPVPLTLSPSKIGGRLKSEAPWAAVDIEMIFQHTPGAERQPIFRGAMGEDGLSIALTSAEKDMSVEEWISAQAKRAEEELRREAERVVGIFEKEGGRAMRALEGLIVSDG